MTFLARTLSGIASAAGLSYEALSLILLIAMFLLLVIGLAMGHELAFVIGGIGILVGVFAFGDGGISISMTKVYDQMLNYNSVSIPMFILMANFLTHSAVADGLFMSMKYLLGPLKGGLGVAVILVSTIFAATTGIVGASVVTMGMLSMPVLLRSKYDPALACGIVCGGGSLGILIPPSIMLVTLGSYSNVSVGRLFAACIIPGLLLSLLYVIYTFVTCHLHPERGPAMSQEELAEMPLAQRIKGSIINMVPPLLLILGVLGSIFTGIATPTEASAVGALVALLMTVAYKQFSLKMVLASILDTAKTTAMVFMIFFGSGAFTGIFMALDGDQLVMNMLTALGLGKWGCLMILFALVFIMGCFLDWAGIVMIVLPIFLPVMDNFGVERTWLCGVIAVLLQTCFMTPPFGYALFFVKSILPSGVNMGHVYKGVIPFVIAVIVVVVACCLFPPLITWLPSVMVA